MQATFRLSQQDLAWLNAEALRESTPEKAVTRGELLREAIDLLRAFKEDQRQKTLA